LVLFDTASNWITRLSEAQHAGRLEAELKKIRRYNARFMTQHGPVKGWCAAWSPV
jgi:hypothetical protein